MKKGLLSGSGKASVIGGRPRTSQFSGELFEFFKYLIREGKKFSTAVEYVREVKKYLRGKRLNTDRFKSAVNRWKEFCGEKGYFEKM